MSLDRTDKTPRRGVRVSDILIVVIVLAVLVAILLPAIQKLRESAMRTPNSNIEI